MDDGMRSDGVCNGLSPLPCLAWSSHPATGVPLSSFSSYNDHVGPVASVHLIEDGFNRISIRPTS